MVHFPGFAPSHLWIQWAVRRFYQRGFPHSEIPGSKPACGSPRLIAACHVLHRHCLPRHPPCALSSLTTKFTRAHPPPFRASGPASRSYVRHLTIAVTRYCERVSHGQVLALIKNTQPCRLPNAIQLSNIVPLQGSSAASAAVEHYCSMFIPGSTAGDQHQAGFAEY